MLTFLRNWLGRIAATFRSRQYDRDLADELDAHLMLLEEEHLRRGKTPDEASRLARISLGGVMQLHEAHREVRGLPFVETLLQDLRYCLRTLRNNAGFTVFAILIVGVGIGASSTIFSAVNALLLRPLPFPDASHLVWIYNSADDHVSEWATQVDHFLDLKRQTKSFSDLAAYFTYFAPGNTRLTEGGVTERLTALQVSQNFFPLLGVTPGAALMSYRLWKRRYSSDSNLIGHSISLNDRQVTVVGVLPEWFDFDSIFSPGSSVDLYVPMPLTAETNRWGNTLAVIARLNSGSTVQSARAEFDVLASTIERQHPDRNTLHPVLLPLQEHVTGRLRYGLVLLAWAVGLVMLIVCANVANLQLARSVGRQREMAIRAAIGAGRRRLIRQVLTESLALSLCGAVLGLALAIAGTRLLAGLTTLKLPLLATIRMDATSVTFSVLVAVVTGLLFGLLPALQIRTATIHDSLKDSSRGSTGSRQHLWIRNTLVVTEIVFACVLLVGAGLLSRSLLKVLNVDMGFQPERAAALRVDPGRKFSAPAEREAYYQRILDKVRRLPGITGAGLTDMVPLAGDRSWGVLAQGRTYPNRQYPEAFIRVVSDGYVQALGVPLRAGRTFTNEDTASSDRVAIINETAARTLWPGQDPLGQIVLAEGSANPGRRIVGVVADVRHRALEQDSGSEVYLPIRQTNDYGAIYLVVRTALAPSAFASSVRQTLLTVAPEISNNEFFTMQGLVDKSVAARRVVVVFLAGFSGFALALAALGIYAVISYSVEQRSAEFGIRMALGASVSDLQGRILLQTLSLAGVGMAMGAASAWAVSRALGSLLFGVTADDPATFLGMMGALTLVACLAGYLPAQRVSKIDPMAALRSS